MTGIPTGTELGLFTGMTTGGGDGDNIEPGFTQFGGWIGTQVGYGELPL